MKIYQATWPAEISQARALQQANVKNRLLSYYFIVTEDDHDPDAWMEEYGKHGIAKDKNRDEKRSNARLKRGVV
jgi:hypothetical protein